MIPGAARAGRGLSAYGRRACALGLIAFLGCAAGDESPTTKVESTRVPAQPEPCRAVSAGADLQRLIDAAEEGTSLCLEAGDYVGPLRVTKSVTLWGPREASIRSTGEGTTIELEASGAQLLGLTVDGSGGRFDLLDAAVHVTGDRNRVEGVLVKNAVFGLLIEKANHALIRDNVVLGPDEGPLGLRGDGVRMWETRNSEVRGNRIIGGRDMVIWYSNENRIVSNTVLRGRYGTHFMYSHDNVVEANRYIDNIVGIFIMYSRNLLVRDNVLARSSGPGGMGLGIKESGNLTIARNLFVANTKNVYMDTAPLHPEDFNTFEDNAFYLSEVAVLMHGSEKRNAFLRNAFVSNHVHVQVEGGGDAMGVRWEENGFDDYAGYDMNRDGFGDIPYELRRLSSQLQGTYPQLQFFRGTIALEFLDAISSLFPLVEPQTTLVDSRPRMDPRKWEVRDAR